MELEQKIEKIINDKTAIEILGKKHVFLETECGNKLYFSIEVGELHVLKMPEIPYKDNHFPVNVLVELRELLRKELDND
jgi:hypothetical protein